MRLLYKTLTLAALAAALLMPAEAAAEAPSYTVVKEKSYLKFVALLNGAPLEGRFNDFSADIRFDPERPEESSVKVEVAISSVAVASGDVQVAIVKPEWLSADAFPKASFASRKLTRMPSSDNYHAEGDLTLRGKTLPVTLNFQITHFDAHSAVAIGSATLSRKDFGVGEGEWSKDDVVKDSVRVEFRIAAEKK